MASNHQQNPYYAAGSPTSPTFNLAFGGAGQGEQNPGYPSSISSNDPLLTQEEADLKRLRNTAVCCSPSRYSSLSLPHHGSIPGSQPAARKQRPAKHFGPPGAASRHPQSTTPRYTSHKKSNLYPNSLHTSHTPRTPQHQPSNHYSTHIIKFISKHPLTHPLGLSPLPRQEETPRSLARAQRP